MLDISVIILTYNEEVHIRRCLDNVSAFAEKIYIVDSFSTDKTIDIAHEYANVVVLQHEWENNHAKQFNWALENIQITSQWIMRLDADEYLLPELVTELFNKLDKFSDDITGVILKRRHYFMDKWMKRGIYPVKLLRIFKNRKGICEQRLMDEHIELLEGNAIELENDFVDNNLNDLSWFCNKHINYAIREAAELLDIEYDLTGRNEKMKTLNLSSIQALHKRRIKYKYAKQPLFLRAFLYFCYRYFIRAAFLDGKIGFLWTFFQGWWYRTLVDAKIFEIKKKCGNDKNEIVSYLLKHYNINL